MLAPAAIAAPAAPAEIGKEARIAFPNHGTVRNFRADGRETVYIQDIKRNWYKASLFGPCPGLPWAQAIGVDTDGRPTFDRFSSLIVRGERCSLSSLVRVEGPPPKKARKAKQDR